MIPLLRADLHFRLPDTSSATKLIMLMPGPTLMTSKGCVISVAIAPEAAAEKLCTLAAWTDEFEGNSLPVRTTYEIMSSYRKDGTTNLTRF